MNIKIKDIPNVAMKGIRLALVCEVCGNEWGVWLMTGTWSLPYKADVCIPCARRKAEQTKATLLNVQAVDNVSESTS